MTTDDPEHWSEANALIRSYGKGALQHASDQIAVFMHEGNDMEMLRWFEIHEHLVEAATELPTWPTD
jgi:hypothetical protein